MAVAKIDRGSLRGALIGCGHIAPRHVAAWQAAGVKLVAVCGLDRAKAEGVAAPVAAGVYTDIERLLADHELDIVDLATRPRPMRRWSRWRWRPA